MKYLKPHLFIFASRKIRLSCVGGSGNTVTTEEYACGQFGGEISSGYDTIRGLCVSGGDGDSFDQCVGGQADTHPYVSKIECMVGSADQCIAGNVL